MEKDQIIILEDRGLISISGDEALDFLQNLTTNDIKNVDINNSQFSSILTPQGKYLCEFFVVKSDEGYFIDCERDFVEELVNILEKFKLQSKVVIRDVSSKHVVGIISKEKFLKLRKNESSNFRTLKYRSSSLYMDPRTDELGARIISPLDKLYLSIKKLSLNITDKEIYYKKAFKLGIPIIGLKYLRNNLFGLEANMEKFAAIDFKKGCFIGQENTARMKLKNKIRKKLMPLKIDNTIKTGSEIKFKEIVVGKVLIPNPYPFGLIKIFDPDLSVFKGMDLLVDNKIMRII